MSESASIDSHPGGSMPRPYSNDLRARVIEDIQAGASRREAAARYELSPSVVVIWAQRWNETGSVAAKPSGGSTSPLEEHAEFLLRLVADRPDVTLDEIVTALRKKGIPGSRTAVWRFFDRRNISYKKTEEALKLMNRTADRPICRVSVRFLRGRLAEFLQSPE